MTNLDQKLQTWINRLFVILVGILPFVFCWVSDELFEFNKMLCVYCFTLIIAALWFTRIIINKQFIFKKTIFDLPILLFVLSQVLSTIFSLHPRTSWLGYYTRLNGGLLSTLSYVLLYYAFVNNITPHYQRRFFQSLFTSGALVSLYAIGEHYGHSLSCLIIKGHFNVSCWVQDVQTRVYATFGQPNWLAAYNATLIGLGTPLTYHFCRHRQANHYLRWLLPCSLLLNFLSLLFTKSRSGIIAFFAGLTVTIFLWLLTWFKHQKQQLGANLRSLALLLLIFLIPMLIWGTQYTPSWKEIISATHAQELTMGLPEHLQGINVNITDSSDIRKIVWRGALDIWRHHPLIGTGVESFAYSYYFYRPADHNWTSEWDFLYNKAHNELLNLAANSGTFGLFTYLSLFATLAFFTFRQLLSPHDLEQDDSLIGICAGLFALSITNFFGFSTVTVQVLLYLYLALAALILPQKNQLNFNLNINTFQNKCSLFIIICLALLGLDQIWRTWYADYNYARCQSLITQSGSSQALEYCLQAVRLRPKEALYQVELGYYYGQYALALARQQPDQKDLAAQFVERALTFSNNGLRLNPHNLNFYKTRYQMFWSIKDIYPQALTLAQQDLDIARTLAPTDPKLVYYSALTAQALDQPESAQAFIDQAISLRPLYQQARLTAADWARAQGDYATAYKHYRYILSFINPQDPISSQAISELATVSGIISTNL